MSEKGTKPGTPAVAEREDASGKKGKAAATVGKPPASGKPKAAGGAVSSTGGGSTARRGGLVSPEPSSSAPAATSEQKEPTDDEYLRQLYAQQQEADRVAALESQHSTLTATVAELHRKIAASESKHVDALMHRKRERQEAAAHTKQLQERIEQLEAQLSAQSALSESTLASTTASHSHAVMLLEDRMGVIQAKYESLHQFKTEKADLELELATLKQLLAREKENHSLNVSELERRNVLEKNRLKNEMLRKIRETKLSLLAMTEDQLHTTTKRTIMENEQMTTELQYQSKETERIVRRNQKLADDNASLKRELELTAATTQQMAKKTQFFQNLITKLQQKLDVLTMERDKQQQHFTAAMQHMQAQVQLAHTQGLPNAGSKFASNDRHSSLSGILRGVEEMNALAAAAASTAAAVQHTAGHHGQGLPLLPNRSSSQQSHQSRKVDSRASHATSTSGPSTAASEEVTRLTSQLAASERERQNLLDQLRQAHAAIREERALKEAAEEERATFQQQLVDMTAALARARTQQVQSSALSSQAVSFIASCLEEQRMDMVHSREQMAAAERADRQATLASMVADGSHSTLVVRAAGEKAFQGAAALQHLEPENGTWDESQGYPSSLSSFQPSEKERILAHLLDQLSAFTRTHPANTPHPLAAAADPQEDVEEEEEQGEELQEEGEEPDQRATPRSPTNPTLASSSAAYPPLYPNPNPARPRSSGAVSIHSSHSLRGTPTPTTHSAQRSAASSRAE